MTTTDHRAGPRPILVDGDEFETIAYADDVIRLRVLDGDGIQVAEYTSTDRDGPPPHSHPWTEVEYVIDGEVEFWIDGKWRRVGPGGVQVLPAGAAHSVRVAAGEARVLMVVIGAPFDGFARDLAGVDGNPDATLADVVTVAGRHGVHLAG